MYAWPFALWKCRSQPHWTRGTHFCRSHTIYSHPPPPHTYTTPYTHRTQSPPHLHPHIPSTGIHPPPSHHLHPHIPCTHIHPPTPTPHSYKALPCILGKLSTVSTFHFQSLTSGYCFRYSLMNSWESGWISSHTFSPAQHTGTSKLWELFFLSLSLLKTNFTDTCFFFFFMCANLLTSTVSFELSWSIKDILEHKRQS